MNALTGKRVCVVQSNYIPWRGFFCLINAVDECVIYDSCQYTKNDWRNRNLIKTPDGGAWLTIPVRSAGRFGQRIYDVKVADQSWAAKHEQLIRQWLGDSHHFLALEETILPLMADLTLTETLHDINVALLRGCKDVAGITTSMSMDYDYAFEGDTASARLASLVAATEADVYVTGPAAQSYLQRNEFDARNIELQVCDYQSLSSYPQAFGPFTPHVSVLDYFANVSREDFSFRVDLKPFEDSP